MRRRRRNLLTRTVPLVTVLVALAVSVLWWTHRDHPTSLTTTTPVVLGHRPPLEQTSRGDASRRRAGLDIDTSAHSTSDPSSIWVVVNKTHPIHPLDFRPDIAIVRGYQVATAAAEPLGRLMDDGDRAGLGLKIASAFRSYDYQVAVHGDLVASEGQVAADKISARPGYSEHQTGLAVDLITPDEPGCDLDQCFAGTAAGSWLRENAWRYGFVVRYTAADRAITGYQPEPWHLRYVGRDLAAAMHASGTATLEQVFGISGGDYPR
ncbi:MAG: D-alanyl-D-alanine carboxypeptidase family protein [Marmoricola sp.]